jgi:hypothetical protein
MIRFVPGFKPRSELFDVKAETTSPLRLGGGGRDHHGRAIPDAGSLGAQAPLSTGKSNPTRGGWSAMTFILALPRGLAS